MSLPSLLGIRGVSVADDSKKKLAAPSGSGDAGAQATRHKKSIPSVPSCRQALRDSTHRHGQSNALTYDGEGPEIKFSFVGLETSSEALARYLSFQRDVRDGDLIATIAENRPELLIVLLSCLKLGVAFVPIASDLRSQDCHTVVELYHPKLIFCDQRKYLPFFDSRGTVYDTIELPQFRRNIHFLDDLTSSCEHTTVEVEVVEVPHRPCIIFSTSGSTGVPKGIVFSFQSIASWADQGLLFQAQSGYKSLVWQPMRGVTGTWLLLQNIFNGGESVMVDVYPSSAVHWAKLIDKHCITSNVLFGSAMHQFLQEMPERRFESIEIILYAGSCFSPLLVQQSMEQFPNAEFWQAYGMTEVGMVSTLMPEDHKRAGEASPEDIARMSSAGKLLPYAEVFVEDADKPGSGLPPPPEKKGVGQICAGTPFMMPGYYKDDEKSREAMPDGKLVRTGDIGKIDEAGFLHILGRIKDVIPTCKGFNVAPRDIEDVLFSHPSVGNAAVVGIPHVSGAGEMVVAWVVAKEGTSIRPRDLQKHCEQTDLPVWQRPEVFAVSTKPLPTIGEKTSRRAMQDPSFVRSMLLDQWRHSGCGERGLPTICFAWEFSAATSAKGDGARVEGAGGLAPEPVQKAALDIFTQLDAKSTGFLDVEDLRPLFGDRADEAFLMPFVSRETPSAGDSAPPRIARLGLDEWLIALQGMPVEELKYWLMLASSILTSWMRR
eukprot:TRINITY_DN7012_c0_g1_i1.p1 TRINITY_DN7012_c0_g1~~TRINITY_DN7012_c0_g1_i1.p1  ORF type:complete len:716 (-),score=108.73 TRINITY_DN7012_c0_g1_i1:350-2497(-)